MPRPLDVTLYTDKPCSVLTEQDATELGAAEAEPINPAVEGPACRWRVDTFEPGSQFHLYLAVALVRNEALADLAKRCVDCGSWATTTIAGYPAIHANGHHELMYGGCALDVAVTDHTYFRVTDNDQDTYLRAVAGVDAGGPRCDRADRTAAVIVRRLEAGG
jgi:hypothetical protein